MLTVYIVTLCREERDPNHDPKNKQIGTCQWSTHCTDVTGAHHSLVIPLPEEAIREWVKTVPGWRITRLEKTGFGS